MSCSPHHPSPGRMLAHGRVERVCHCGLNGLIPLPGIPTVPSKCAFSLGTWLSRPGWGLEQAHGGFTPVPPDEEFLLSLSRKKIGEENEAV